MTREECERVAEIFRPLANYRVGRICLYRYGDDGWGVPLTQLYGTYRMFVILTDAELAREVASFPQPKAEPDPVPMPAPIAVPRQRSLF